VVVERRCIVHDRSGDTSGRRIYGLRAAHGVAS
jgi:hypothetical protein